MDDLAGLEREVAGLLAEFSAPGPEPDTGGVPIDVDEEARLVVAEAIRRQPAGPRSCALEFVARRRGGELLGHVLGSVKFFDCQLLTSPDCLVPRKETEVLAQAGIELLRSLCGPSGVSCIDMCCGAGNVACALAHHVQAARIWAADSTDGCVNLARRNVARLGLGERVQVLQGDLFSAFADLDLQGRMDLIVCNPPYISSGRLAGDRASLLAQEPRDAFDGGPYGLSIHQRLLRDAPAFLRPGGWLAFEIGVGQERQIELLIQRFRGVYGAVRWERDSSDRPRTAVVQRM